MINDLVNKPVSPLHGFRLDIGGDRRQFVLTQLMWLVTAYSEDHYMAEAVFDAVQYCHYATVNPNPYTPAAEAEFFRLYELMTTFLLLRAEQLAPTPVGMEYRLVRVAEDVVVFDICPKEDQDD